MKTRSHSISIFILLFFLLQAKFVLGQVSANALSSDTLITSKTFKQKLEKEKVFSLFKRKRKKDQLLKNDSLQIAKADTSDVAGKDSLSRKKQISKKLLNASKRKLIVANPLKGEKNTIVKNEEKIQDFFKSDSLKRQAKDSVALTKNTEQKDSIDAPQDTVSTTKHESKMKDGIKDRFSFSEKKNIPVNPVASTKAPALPDNKITQAFHLMQNGKLQGKDSLFKKNNTDSLKNKGKQVIPALGATQNLFSKKDSLLNKKDSLFSKSKTRLKSIDLKAFVKKELKTLKPHGTISAGYDYGVLPFAAGNNYPSGGYRTEGNVAFLLLNVPLELTYYYTDVKNTIGLNNYFRISYDASRYKDQLSEKLNVKNKLKSEQLGKLQLQQQGVMQKIEYLNLLNQSTNYKFPDNDRFKNKYLGGSSKYIPKDSFTNFPNPSVSPVSIDTSKLFNQYLKTDSLTNNYSRDYSKYLPKDSLSNFSNPSVKPVSIDTSKLINQYFKTDSLKNSNDYMRKKDSISNELNAYKAKYDSINDMINKVKKEIDQINNIQKTTGTYTNPYLSKIQNILSGIQKFEIGLCHPSYSTFLVNNIPLKGINFEYAKNNKFLAFTYGTTINNLLYNPNTIQGKLQGARNLYNYFDFGNLTVGRKVLSLKGGIGAKDDSHLYVGFLLGKGRSDYMQMHLPDNSSTTYSKESNLVLELDGKYKFSDQLSVDVILGKSSIKEEDISMEQIKKSVNEIFSNYRSYAFLTRINVAIRKTKTKFTFTTRWIDPYFKSFGIGFIRSDNFRYEIKAEQQITKKIKYTIAYRREEDNLLKLYNYKNTLQSINNSLNLKLNRQLNLRLIYTPLFRELRTPSTVIKDRNTISTVILSYTPKPKVVTSQFNLLYSKYIISGDSSNINFENFTYTHQFTFKKGFKTDLNVTWFKNNLKDTLGNDTYLAVLGIGYVAQNKNSFTIAGKMAYKNKIEPQYGFVVKTNIKLYKGLSWEAQVEKIIIGDYYSSFMVEKIQQFPYYCSTRLVLNF